MDTLPPDPYLALGVPRDATAATIKTTYRKLVLKCHPDKIQDEALKQEASDKFHKIQSAYEIIGDEERRARYDAQAHLAELRRDVMSENRGAPRSGGGVDVRTAAYKMPTESRGGEFYARGPERFTKVSPQYEERRPSYAQEDYFEQPRTSSRKYDEYERPSKRSSPKEERPKAKPSSKDTKENERSSRKEKSRRTEKDVRRDRDRKTAYATVQEDTGSDSDPYERRARAMAAEEEEAWRQRLRAQEYESRRQREEPVRGTYADDHIPFVSDYINRSREVPREQSWSDSDSRPSPVRHSSSKDKVHIRKGENGKPPVMYRTVSGKPKATTRESMRAREPEYVEEIREPRRSEAREKKPTLFSAKSAPGDIRPPFERQRSHSMQDDQQKEQPPVPPIRRSETMPTVATREARGRKEGSKLRPEEAYATPERTPEPESRSSKYRYGQQYADDYEVPTPDGYRTEVREPASARRQRFTRSPSPIKVDRERERQRSASSKYATAAPQQPPPLPRTTSTTYVYPGGAREESYVRPSVSRENSGRLYGEVPRTAASPRQTYTYSPPPERVSVRPSYGPEDVKIQTGYTRRPEKPNYRREHSSRQPVY